MGDNRHRILLSAYACEPNKGSEPGVGWNWATHLADYFEVYVITRKNNQRCIEEYLKNHPVENIHFYYHDCMNWMKKAKRLPNGIFLYYKRWQSEILPLAECIVREEKIELVHHITFNEFRTPGKFYRIGIPFVWGPIGGGQFYSPTFKNAFFRKSDVVKEYVRNGINRIYLGCSKDIKQTVQNAAAILIADQSTEMVMPQTREYIRLLETGYNLNRNEIKKYTKRNDKDIKLLWVGGIWPRKGLKLLLDALGNSQFRNFQLDVIGSGNDMVYCKRLVETYGLHEHIHFLGSLPYDEVNEHYDNADVFIFTSLRDTSGNVVLEAMSHGLPVVALNHHGVGEIVTGETGMLIEVSSYVQMQQDIINAIQYYQNNRNILETQGRAGRKRLEDVYSWKHNVAIMRQVYLNILEEK